MSDVLKASKVPAVTLAFWVAKIMATTLGETGGDAVSMSMGLGYLAATGIFAAIFAVALTLQVGARRYHPATYWFLIVATTTVGTTISDYLDRTAGLGYPLASAILLGIVVAILIAWRLATGSISVTHISDRRDEIFYWIAITVSNTLGTALGDYTSDSLEMGFSGGALLFGGLIALIAVLYFVTRIPRALLFWAAFILTRPLGATLGDILTKPLSHGGLDLGRFGPSAVLLVAMVLVIAFTSLRRPAPVGAPAH